ncbi:MAG: glucuronate isomerase [Planctomycetales bacterium]|nr:glucuronate isomerase [Planctomycetales bacterium]
MPFIHDDFLLQTDAACRLYHEFAASEPILDYHTHLPPGEIAANHRFENLAEIWLAGDHYKWRAMRANGVEESLCTGDAEPYDKFLAWARTVPHTLRNPLYHWTHLELKRYFDIDELLNEQSAPRIWEQANEKLQGEDLTPRGIFQQFDVRCVCTTDDPTDDLSHHRAIAASDLPTKVYPTFRPDAALRIDEPKEFDPWLEKLSAAADVDIATLDDLVAALKKRHDYFHVQGCRLSDHGLERCYASFIEEQQAAQIFSRAREGKEISRTEQHLFASYMMLHFGRWDAERGWTKQLHIGPLRNNNVRLFQQLGRDVGCDSIGDLPQANLLSAYLNRLDHENALPKTILYNINPADNAVFATMIGNFQGDGIPGKVQWGSGWWFLDQWEGMQDQLNTLSNQGLLSRFVGMLTDSRSLLSYPRHEYFRRCLCDLLGSDVERGAIPDDDSLLGPMIRNICFGNARDYLGLALD